MNSQAAGPHETEDRQRTLENTGSVSGKSWFKVVCKHVHVGRVLQDWAKVQKLLFGPSLNPVEHVSSFPACIAH